MLSEFALYWDMLSSIDLRINRKNPEVTRLIPFQLNTLNQQGAKLYVLCTSYSLTSKPAKPNFNLMSMAANYLNFSRSN